MKAKGIRIKNRINGYWTSLKDILAEIQDGELFYWSILFFYGDGTLKDGRPIMDFEEEVRKSEKGMPVKWNELNELTASFSDVWDITILGCKDEKLILRYKNDQEMYESCDIVIELIDSSYWEIFSKDINLINRLAAKFEETILLDSDFIK
jgi:hypothetical protein